MNAHLGGNAAGLCQTAGLTTVSFTGTGEPPSRGGTPHPRPGSLSAVDRPEPEAGTPESDLELGLVAIGPVSTERKARDWALVLQSIPVWHTTRRAHAGFFLIVRDSDYPRASASIDRYEVENRDWPPPVVRERPRHALSMVGPLIFLALVAFFAITGPVSGGAGWFARGSSVADSVLGSQPWRAVTALTLHADGAHVLGNAISGSIFASAVNRRLGPGAGSLAVLASGALGNAANALFHHSIGDGQHGSIGASTAVFGAIGLLAATQMVLDRPERAGHKRNWFEVARPFVGGLALLGALGASPRSDLGAHAFGLLAGILVGLFALGPRRLLQKPLAANDIAASLRFDQGEARSRWYIQPLLGALALGIVIGSWQLALS